jgi:hypothetical protein
MRYGKYMRIKAGANQLPEFPEIKKNIMDQEMEQRIWEFIDGRSTDAEKAAIIQKLAENPLWKSRYQELLSVHEMLLNETLDMPSLRFTKNVMEEIAQYQVAPATKNYINKNVIGGIGAFFLLMIIGLFIYFIGQIHWSSSSTGNLVPAYSIDANKLNWGKLLNNSYVNIFFGITAILALILIDKYMQTKKNTVRPEH